MNAICLILNDLSKLDEILEIFYNSGCGATTLDSVGLGKILINNKVDIPIFAGMRRIIEGNKPYNKTIISMIRTEDKLREVVDKINKELDYDNNPGVGFMFVTPVSECYGLSLED
jgi:nitrogen regulatory protein PII